MDDARSPSGPERHFYCVLYSAVREADNVTGARSGVAADESRPEHPEDEDEASPVLGVEPPGDGAGDGPDQQAARHGQREAEERRRHDEHHEGDAEQPSGGGVQPDELEARRGLPPPPHPLET